MSLNAVKILKINVTRDSKKEVLKEIQKYLERTPRKPQKSLKIFTPNTEQLVYAVKNPKFSAILNQADIAVPDTIGVVWASHLLAKNGPTAPIPGIELMEDVVQIAADHHVPIGLIGGRGNLAIDTLNCLQQKYSGLTGWAEEGPEISMKDGDLMIQGWTEIAYFARVAKHVRDSKAGVVFVALGPPKQEFFIEKLSGQLSVISKSDRRSPITDNSGIVFMAVGGSFDIISGRLSRAPAFMRKLGLEWLWRLILEPWRIMRQLALVEFVWLVLREKFFHF